MRHAEDPHVNVLVIDNDLRNRELCCHLLRELGCTDPRFVDCGAEALRVAEVETDLDLILLELELPDVHGIEICRRLVALLPTVPIIVVTGRSDAVAVRDALDNGAHDFMTKPLRAIEFLARARVAQRLRSERLRHFAQEQRLTTRARRLEKTKTDLERIACIDQLTGIANRRHFDTLLQIEWKRAARNHTQLSLVMLDLDDFHALNELYGHLGGDLRLKNVAEAMTKSLQRPSDVIARYGGEEFVALLPDTSTEGGFAVAERMRACVENLRLPHATSRCSDVVTISAGVATVAPRLEDDPEKLIEAADVALFRAKAEGRNRCCAEIARVAKLFAV